MITQVCNKCNIEKDVSLFEWQKNRPNPRKTCKLCRSRVPRTEEQIKKRAEYVKNLYSRRKDHYRYVAEKSLYGVSKDQFEYDYCAICGSKKRLHIDHCHKSGDVRGLLCQNCNFGIGNLKDSIDNLKAAILYLQNPPALNKPHFQIEGV